MSEKFREFHLNPKGTWLKVTDLIRNNKPEDHVHVIEYAAYDQLKQDLEDCIEALEFYGDKSNWHEDDDTDSIFNACESDDEENIIEKGYSYYYGGKLARETISKLKYKKESK